MPLSPATFYMQCLHFGFNTTFVREKILLSEQEKALLPRPVDLGDIGTSKNDSDELNKRENEADPDVDPGEGVLYQVPLQHHLQDLDAAVLPDANVVSPRRCLRNGNLFECLSFTSLKVGKC